MDDIIKKYPNDVKIVFKNAPRGNNMDDSNSKFTTAVYAVAAGRQGKFLDMHHKLFDNFSELRKNPDLPLQLAAELGLDVQQLKADFNSSEVRDFVKAEKDQFSALRNQGMERMGIPKFLINGKEPSSRSLESWSALIDEIIKK